MEIGDGDRWMQAYLKHEIEQKDGLMIVTNLYKSLDNG